MPKPYTFPTLFDECRTITIKRLKEWGYLKHTHMNRGVISWLRYGDVVSSIGAFANTMNPDGMYIELEYTSNDEVVKYQIPLVAKKSNLGKGEVWFFICPVTNKLCRKLHGIGKQYLHRSAHTGCMYGSQTYSKKFRWRVPILSAKYDESLYDTKHMKKHYRGRPTKRYLKVLKRRELAESYSEEALLYG